MGGIQLIDNFKYSGKKFLDGRKTCESIASLIATDENSLPDGFCKYVEEEDAWYQWRSDNEVLSDTGKWRPLYHGREVINNEFVYAICDRDGRLLWGIKHDGSSYQPKGIPEEVQDRFNELSGWQLEINDEFVFGIVDSLGQLLFGIDRNGKLVGQRGITVDGGVGGLDLMSNEDYIFAITDSEGHMAFGIHKDGSVEFDKGVPREVQTRLDELQGLQQMRDANFVYAITDKNGQVLMGIRYDGTVYFSKQAVTEGEPMYWVDENILMYEGRASGAPILYLDGLELKVEYPGNYDGPPFLVDDGMLFI